MAWGEMGYLQIWQMLSLMGELKLTNGKVLLKENIERGASILKFIIKRYTNLNAGLGRVPMLSLSLWPLSSLISAISDEKVWWGGGG